MGTVFNAAVGMEDQTLGRLSVLNGSAQYNLVSFAVFFWLSRQLMMLREYLSITTDRYRHCCLTLMYVRSPTQCWLIPVGEGVYSADDLQRFGRELARLHKPAQRDHWARYGLTRPQVPEPVPEPATASASSVTVPVPDELLSSHKVARQLGMTTPEFLARVEFGGLAILTDGVHQASERALKLGAENRVFRNKPYIAWPVALVERLRPQSGE